MAPGLGIRSAAAAVCAGAAAGTARLCLLAGGLLLVAAPAPAATPAGSPASSAAAAPAATDAAVPGPADLDAMLAAVCGAGHVAAAPAPVGRECRGVPAYPARCNGPLQIDAVTGGSFTRAGAVEALADYEGCEPHAGNFGGSVLLRRRPAGWERLAFLPGLRAATCLRFPRRGGTDALACYAAWSGQGEEDGSIQLLRFDAAGKLAAADVRHFSATFWNPQLCRRGEVGRASSFETFAGWTRIPASGKRPSRLLVRVETERFAVPKLCAAAPDDAAEDDPVVARFAAWRKVRARIVTRGFDWDGSRFTPAPAPAASPRR